MCFKNYLYDLLLLVIYKITLLYKYILHEYNTFFYKPKFNIVKTLENSVDMSVFLNDITIQTTMKYQFIKGKYNVNIFYNDDEQKIFTISDRDLLGTIGLNKRCTYLFNLPYTPKSVGYDNVLILLECNITGRKITKSFKDDEIISIS